MKLNTPRSFNQETVIETPVLLKRLSFDSIKKHMLKTFKCRTQPVDVGSPTYKVAIPFFSSPNNLAVINKVKDFK